MMLKKKIMVGCIDNLKAVKNAEKNEFFSLQLDNLKAKIIRNEISDGVALAKLRNAKRFVQEEKPVKDLNDFQLYHKQLEQENILHQIFSDSTYETSHGIVSKDVREAMREDRRRSGAKTNGTKIPTMADDEWVE